jgi:hypothetical protein
MRIFISAVFLLLTLNAVALRAPGNYYDYQVGLSFGIGSSSAPKMKLGDHYGIMLRYHHHTVILRREDYSDIAIFTTSSYMLSHGISYGWTTSVKNAQCSFLIGGGMMDYRYNHGGNNIQRGSGLYGEATLCGMVNWRGNGIGLRFNANVNPLEPYFSAGFYIQAGWAWNKKSEIAN